MAKTTKPMIIEGEMTIYRAAELKEVLAPCYDPAAAKTAPRAIDLSAVTEIDCSGVQLLALAKREAAEGGRELSLEAPSPAVSEVFTLLGLAPLLAAA
jgi:anti-anti-sigma factor